LGSRCFYRGDVASFDFLHINSHYLSSVMDAGTPSLVMDAFSTRCRTIGARRDELQALLLEKVEGARAAWPTVAIDLGEFAAYLATRLQEDEDPLAGLQQLRVADLYLAFAAVRGAHGAVEAFETALLGRVGTFVSRIDSSRPFVDEVKQALRIKLFVDDGGKIAQYSGRGSLESWVCAVAIRIAYDLRRAEVRHHPRQDEEDVGLLAASIDVELEMLRARYKGEFRAALQEAIAGLDARQRTLLRLYFLERLTTAQIGRLYRVHETTALRWIAAARQAIVEGIRSALERKLKVSKTEFDDLIGIVQSQLDVSFSRILGTTHHTEH
jgi:RNA polymerase sigma-70 factor, ECF subfamily